MEQNWDKILEIAKEVIPDEIDCLTDTELDRVCKQVKEGTFVPQERIKDSMPDDIGLIVNVVGSCITAISILFAYYSNKRMKEDIKTVLTWLKNDMVDTLELSKNQSVIDFVKEHYDEIVNRLLR